MVDLKKIKCPTLVELIKESEDLAHRERVATEATQTFLDYVLKRVRQTLARNWSYLDVKASKEDVSIESLENVKKILAAKGFTFIAKDEFTQREESDDRMYWYLHLNLEPARNVGPGILRRESVPTSLS